VRLDCLTPRDFAHAMLPAARFALECCLQPPAGALGTSPVPEPDSGLSISGPICNLTMEKL